MAKRDASHLAAAATAKKPKQNASITSFFGAPKVKAARFDKGKWVAGLTPEQKELLQLEIDTLDESWLAHLKDEIVTKEFLDLKRFLKKQQDSGVKVFPPPEDIYSWYEVPELSLPTHPKFHPEIPSIYVHVLNQDDMIEGLDIPRYRKSRQLFLARTLTITMVRLTVSASLSAHRLLHHLR